MAVILIAISAIVYYYSCIRLVNYGGTGPTVILNWPNGAPLGFPTKFTYEELPDYVIRARMWSSVLIGAAGVLLIEECWSILRLHDKNMGEEG